MEKPNGAGWAACTDKKCYLEQGGKITLHKKKEEPIEIPLEDFRWDSNEVELPDDDEILTLNFVPTDLIFLDVDELRIRFKGSGMDYIVETKKIEQLFAMISTRKEPIQ